MTTTDGEIRLWNTSVSDNNWQFYQLTAAGTLQARSDACRVTGATDGVTNYGWAFQKDTNGTNTAYFPHRAVALLAHVGSSLVGGSHTCTFYLCGTTTLDNAQVWMELETMDDVSDQIGAVHTSRAGSPAATGTTLTTDTSDWTQGAASRANTTAYTVGQVIKVSSNSGRLFVCTTAGTSSGSLPGGYATAVDGGTVTDGSATFTAVNRYKVVITWTPQQPGIVRGYLYFATTGTQATTYVFVDPMLNVA